MNAKNIISMFGGIRPLARLLGYPPSTVQNWERRNSIPAKQQQKLLLTGIETGLKITPNDFFNIPPSKKPKNN